MSDTTDDLEYGIDMWDMEVKAMDREAEWRKGKHTTKAGNTIKIKDMETSHLQNTIRHFSHLNTKPLERELKKRLT